MYDELEMMVASYKSLEVFYGQFLESYACVSRLGRESGIRDGYIENIDKMILVFSSSFSLIKTAVSHIEMEWDVKTYPCSSCGIICTGNNIYGLNTDLCVNCFQLYNNHRVEEGAD